MGGGAGAFANLMRLGSSFREAPSTGALTDLTIDLTTEANLVVQFPAWLHLRIQQYHVSVCTCPIS